MLLLQKQLSAGTTDPGLLGGPADRRLSPAIVAMHERPGKPWRIEQLAEITGLSTSRFADRFTESVGPTPMSYLRRWRMVLAHRDVQHGDRIQTVATRYSYASGEALSRAFRRHFGANPTTTSRPKVRRDQAIITACTTTMRAVTINSATAVKYPSPTATHHK